MDQDAFRQLLSTTNGASSTQKTPTQRGSLLGTKSKGEKSKEQQGAKAEFKPRKIKKEGPYRDRAAERRSGVAGDFAGVEAVLDSFEKQHADAEDRDAVEEKRKYLGGDSEHSVLVKGLDFALLEQTKARVAQVDDDDSLEDAFRSASSSVPKKRTREDIIRELKEKRSKGDTGDNEAIPEDEKVKIEKLKQEGKFKPIGFKPIGSTFGKGKDTKDGTKKKKKRKLDAGAADNATKAQATSNNTAAGPSSAPEKPSTPISAPTQAPEPGPLDDDFDIFADAGDYKGIDYGDEDEDDLENRVEREEESVTSVLVKPGKWFVDDEPEETPERSASPNEKGKGKSKADERDGSEPQREAEPEPELEPEQPTRLMPLASSAVPSIRDMLAADEELEREEKRKARKEKKKAGGGGGGGDGGDSKKSAEAKLARDYQKLKSYQERKKDA